MTAGKPKEADISVVAYLVMAGHARRRLARVQRERDVKQPPRYEVLRHIR